MFWAEGLDQVWCGDMRGSLSEENQKKQKQFGTQTMFGARSMEGERAGIIRSGLG